jgi:hypothetical protein
MVSCLWIEPHLGEFPDGFQGRKHAVESDDIRQVDFAFNAVVKPKVEAVSASVLDFLDVMQIVHSSGAMRWMG